MAETAQCDYGITIDGQAYVRRISVTADGVIRKNPQGGVPAGQSGLLTTRTSDSVGVITLDNDPVGLNATDRVAVFWSGGRGYNAEIQGITGKAVEIAGLTGGILPSEGSAVVLSRQHHEEFQVSGSKVAVLAVRAGSRGLVLLDDGATPAVFDVDATRSYLWDKPSGVANPVAGMSILEVWFANADTTGSKSMSVVALFD